jgi:chromosome segregation protein
MRLESITLHGFKSFAERTSIKVLPGITAIVGPNGCGKSNISESVRWALGEQSAKSLRGQRMEDLIFHGSASRKAVGLAEVELLFSNDGALSVPWSEIAVSRRLYRSGESEYLLNRNSSRLRDILDLFAGTGANPRAYSVIDQDKLNHVLTAKPHERRVFIEEAAGIARYKQQRSETEGKLDAARQNLHRVKDVMQEVQRQLGSLERQARKAQQYKALEAERRDLALALLAADYAALKTEAERREAQLARLRLVEEDLQARVTQLGTREARQQEVIQSSEHRLADLRQAAHKVQGELERLLERREQMGLQMQEAAEESGRLDEEANQAGARLHGIVDEREGTRAALAEAGLTVAARQQAVAELEAALERHRSSLTGERDRLEALRLEQIRLASERTDLVRSAGELRERASQCRRRSERLAAELAGTEAEAARLTVERGALETSRERTLRTLSSLTVEREQLVALLSEGERAAASAEKDLAESRLARAGRQSSLEALRELERGREGYGSGVRAVFAEGAQIGLSGIVGTVADLLDVPPELERPVAAVLGDRLQWIVVERFEHARAAVGFLRSRQAGSATFVPLEDLRRYAGAVASPEDNGVRWLSRSVRASTEGLLEHLLGLVGVVDHLDHAEALWRRNGVIATYVTPDGDVLGPHGHLRGGGDEAAGASEHALLARKRQVRELEEIVRGLEEMVASTQRSAARLGAEAASLRVRLTACDETLAAHHAQRLAGEKDLEQVTREHERVHRHSETVRLESEQNRREIEETETTLARLDQRIATACDAEGAHEVAQAGVRRTIEAAQAREAALVGELTAGRVDAASGRERLDSLERELGRLDQLEAELQDRLAQTAQRGQQLAERREWLAAERERTDAQARDVAVERDRVQSDEQAAADRHAGFVEELRTIQEEMRGIEGERRRVTASIHEVELAATEGRVRREELLQDAVRTYTVDEPTLLARHDPTREIPALRNRHDELQEKLTAIGPVNLVADEEYRELDERLTFLRVQHDDLVGSIKDLEKALRGMTRTAQERFDQAFAEISARFSEIFERLFEGGRAELRLVEAEEGGDPLDTGVDLVAQPRGKRLQSVTLMSGGERALTGLALLFAIFYYRPSPFCVLDEVDAPLDDANIHRFLRVLRELTSQTQFLVITHNRKSMEAADVLYGVTMQEPGLSTLVSVNLRDV